MGRDNNDKKVLLWLFWQYIQAEKNYMCGLQEKYLCLIKLNNSWPFKEHFLLLFESLLKIPSKNINSLFFLSFFSIYLPL